MGATRIWGVLTPHRPRDRSRKLALRTCYGTLAWPWLSSRYILAHVRPGAVVILHDRGARAKRTAEVLGRVLPELRARGYEIVTLTQLVSDRQ